MVVCQSFLQWVQVVPVAWVVALPTGGGGSLLLLDAGTVLGLFQVSRAKALMVKDTLQDGLGVGRLPPRLWGFSGQGWGAQHAQGD